MDWIAKNLARALAVAAAVLLVAALLALHGCRRAATARAETRVATGQAGAALASGQDGVATIGNRMAADASTDIITKENDDALRNGPGAAAPVDAVLTGAGLAGLCRYAAYRGDPRCVRHADPR